MEKLFSLPRRMPVWIWAGLLSVTSVAYVANESFAHDQPPKINESAMLQPRNRVGDDGFGFAVAIERDLAIVGAPQDIVIVVALDDCTMSVTKAPQNAPDNGVAAILRSVGGIFLGPNQGSVPKVHQGAFP